MPGEVGQEARPISMGGRPGWRALNLNLNDLQRPQAHITGYGHRTGVNVRNKYLEFEHKSKTASARPALDRRKQAEIEGREAASYVKATKDPGLKWHNSPSSSERLSAPGSCRRARGGRTRRGFSTCHERAGTAGESPPCSLRFAAL